MEFGWSLGKPLEDAAETQGMVITQEQCMVAQGLQLDPCCFIALLHDVQIVQKS